MVFLAITPQGLQQALQLQGNTVEAVWCGADAISDVDYVAHGVPSLSRFIYPLQNATAEVLEDALGTIREHHPGSTVWVEQAEGRLGP